MTLRQLRELAQVLLDQGVDPDAPVVLGGKRKPLGGLDAPGSKAATIGSWRWLERGRITAAPGRASRACVVIWPETGRG